MEKILHKRFYKSNACKRDMEEDTEEREEKRSMNIFNTLIHIIISYSKFFLGSLSRIEFSRCLEWAVIERAIQREGKGGGR